MKFLEDAIRTHGQILPNNIVKVDNFLNHQIDPYIINKCAETFFELYKDSRITRIVTIEASGIAIAYACANFFRVPVVFAKKQVSANILSSPKAKSGGSAESDNGLYTSVVDSFTKKTRSNIVIAKKYLSNRDTVLIIDDFLAVGGALTGIIDIVVRQAGATLAGCGIVIEKGFQSGGAKIRGMGYRVESLAIISEFKEGGDVEFVPQKEVPLASDNLAYIDRHRFLIAKL